MMRYLLVFAAAVSWLEPVDAHPFHTSHTEMEWNGETQRYEVAMRLRISDLESALSIGRKTHVSIEDPTLSVALLKKYLLTNFAVFSGTHTECTLHWVGMELELHDAWIYFEAEPRSRIQQATSPSGSSVKRNVDTWDQLFQKSETSPGNHVSVPWGADGVTISNSVLMEIQPEQVNIVQLRNHGRSESLALSLDSKSGRLFGAEKPVRSRAADKVSNKDQANEAPALH